MLVLTITLCLDSNLDKGKGSRGNKREREGTREKRKAIFNNNK